MELKLKPLKGQQRYNTLLNRRKFDVHDAGKLKFDPLNFDINDQLKCK